MHHMLIYSQILLCMRPVLSHKHGNLILHDKICFPAVITVAGYRLPIPADCLQSSQGIPGEVAQTLFLPDNIEVQTAVSSIGNKSFTLVQRIVEVPTDTVKCICTTVMVGFDQATHESKPISEEWKRAISEYEHRLFS